MKAIAIIPARYKSKRFPGKPLALISGVPLIARVMQSARNSQRINDVIVATDDQRIAQAVKDCGGNVFFSQREHATGSDRVAEAATELDCDYVVNLQGDEPFLPANVIDEVVGALDDPDVVMSSGCSLAPIQSATDAVTISLIRPRGSSRCSQTRSISRCSPNPPKSFSGSVTPSAYELV